MSFGTLARRLLARTWRRACVALLATLATAGLVALGSAPAWAAYPTLRYGSTGSAVVTLQQRLIELHYDVGAVDGIFGYSTYHGVVAFEKVNKMARDGIVDADVWYRLSHPFVPHARFVRGGGYLEVDLTRQVVYYLRNGAISRILDASTGGGYYYYSNGILKYAYTPTGTWRIYLRIPGWYDSSVGWMYDSNFYYRGFAVHGSSSVPNYPASHGCVRVTVPAMARLWPRLFVGMYVSVYRT